MRKILIALCFVFASCKELGIIYRDNIDPTKFIVVESGDGTKILGYCNVFAPKDTLRDTVTVK